MMQDKIEQAWHTTAGIAFKGVMSRSDLALLPPHQKEAFDIAFAAGFRSALAGLWKKPEEKPERPFWVLWHDGLTEIMPGETLILFPMSDEEWEKRRLDWGVRGWFYESDLTDALLSTIESKP